MTYYADSMEGRVFAISDLHGQYDLLEKILDYITPSDTVFNLGDNCDRGEHGYEILSTVIQDKRFINLKGNHEEMLLDYFKRPSMNNKSLWTSNGGLSTLVDIEDLAKRMKERLLIDIDSFSTREVFINKDGKIIHLDHCGFTPGYSYEPYWDRGHFAEWWDEEEYGDIYVVHGHTPVQYFLNDYRYVDNEGKMVIARWEYEEEDPVDKAKNPEIINYCNGHKYNIDLCSCATHKVALLDLNTLKPIYFTTKGE